MSDRIRSSPVILAFAVFALVLGGALVGLSFLPYAEVKRAFDHLAVDGDAGFLSPDRHLLLARCMTMLGAFVAGLGIVVLRVGDKAAALAASLVKCMGSDLAGAPPAVGRLWRAEERLHLIFVATIFVAGIAMRVGILNEPIRSDEAYTFMNFASKPLLQGVSDYSAPNNHLLHTVLVHLSTRLLGTDPWAIRVPAFLAGSLIPLLTYILGRVLFDKDTGLLAASLTAVSSILIEYSTYARGYSIVTAICLLLFTVCAVLLRRKSLTGWSSFVLLSVLGFASMPTMLYPWIIALMWVGIGYIRLRDYRGVAQAAGAAVIVVLGTLLVYSPALVVTGPAMIASNSYVLPLAWSEFASRFPASLYDAWMQWNRDIPRVLQLLLLGCAALAAVRRSTDLRRPGALVASVLVVSGLLPAAQRVVPFPRVWQFLVPIYFVFASEGISLIWRFVSSSSRIRGSAVAGALALAATVGLGIASLIGHRTYLPGDGFEDAEAVAGFLKERLQEGDRVVAAVPAISPLEYYFARSDTSLGYLYTKFSEAERLYVVVDRRRQSLQWVLQWAEVPLSDFTGPSQIQQVGNALVYCSEAIPWPQKTAVSTVVRVPAPKKIQWP